MTPAGPLPRIRYFIISLKLMFLFKVKSPPTKRSGGLSITQLTRTTIPVNSMKLLGYSPRLLLLSRCHPYPSHGVRSTRKHFRNSRHQAFRRTFGCCLGGQPSRQLIVFLGQSGFKIEELLHVPDPLTNFLEFFLGPIAFTGSVNLHLNIAKTPREAGRTQRPDASNAAVASWNAITDLVSLQSRADQFSPEYPASLTRQYTTVSDRPHDWT